MRHNIYFYIAVMAIVTYLIRMLPLTLFRRQIKNKFIRIFLYYVPYATLAAMTFPAILHATKNIWSGFGGFLCALILAYKKKNMIVVALAAAAAVFLLELLI